MKTPPTAISPEAREAAINEALSARDNTQEPGHFVQQLLDAQSSELNGKLEASRCTSGLLDDECKALVLEVNQLRQQLSSLRVIAEGLNFLADEVSELNNHGQPTMIAMLAMNHQERYKEWLTLNPETKNV